MRIGADGVSKADILVRFNCKAVYLRHEPKSGGDRLRIYLEPTGICNGTSPLVAASRSRLRPQNSDDARLLELEYDGSSSTEAVLTFVFSEEVQFDVEMRAMSFDLGVGIDFSGVPTPASIAAPDGSRQNTATTSHRQVVHAKDEVSKWAVNLRSLQRVPTLADAANLTVSRDQQLYYSEIGIDGDTWFRLRLGNFDSVEDANKTLLELQQFYPGAWIDKVDSGASTVRLATTGQDQFSELNEDAPDIPVVLSKVDGLMEDARKSMITGDISRAVQIYTKVMQLPEHPRQPDAQEYLALAREKKGQLAHAKAEYERYLSLYPDAEGATRVKQRLAALVANNRQDREPAASTGSSKPLRKSRQDDWRINVYASQYYRRDVNQQNDQEEVVNQSALYSDVNIDARRRGDRFDFSSRIKAGYRSNFLTEGNGSNDPLRISYAYVDVADTDNGVRVRLGRQSRNSGGVLGRFDGLSLGYDLNEKFGFHAVYGMPAYRSSDSIDSERSFYGASVDYRPPLDGLELGMFFVQQDIEGITDRQAVGAEFRYFGEKQSVWGLVDYDTAYDELGSAFLQASWRFRSRASVHASVDRRHSPFLSAGNALIGQAVASFAELLELYPVEELRQFGLDRSPQSTTFTVGLSHSLSPKFQVNVDVNQSTIDDAPASGGVLAIPGSEFNFYSGSLIASSLLKEGDVSILSVRYSDSNTSRVTSVSLDSRFPFGRTWRLNPRLRVDKRQRLANTSNEWLYTPGIRIQFRRSQKFRIEFEAGKQFSQQDVDGVDLDRESYFLNLGYQVFF